MISIWEIIVAGVYPAGEVGYIIGIFILVMSIILSLLILPFLIYFLDKFYKLSKKIPLCSRGSRSKEKRYEFDTYRIIIAFLITDVVVRLLSITLSSHGIYFLSTMYEYRDYLYQFDALSNSTTLKVYVIPFSHYILYLIYALYQATQESTILWVFLFLANYICNLIDKPFHFKTFAIILLIRITLTFGFNFNLWDVIMNEVQNNGLHMVGLAAYPLNTFENSYKSIWLLYSLIVFVPFSVYLRRLTSQKLRSLSIAQDNIARGDQEDEVLIRDRSNVISIAEIKLVVRYSRIYIVFLVVILAKTIFECYFPSFALRYTGVSDAETGNILKITLSAIDIVLSCLPALMLLAFIFLGYSAARDIAVRRNESEDTSRKNVAYYCKKLLTIGGIIFLFSFCCTGMIGYLHFVANDYFQITLMPGDFIELNNGNTSYSSFSETCDTLKYSRTPPYVLTPFDKMKLIYENHSHYEYCPNSQDLGFYKHSQQLPEYREQIHIFSSTRFPVMWFPAGTTLSNFTSYPLAQNSGEDWPLNFSFIPYPYPCYKDYIRNDPNRGLGVICSNYDRLKENPFNLTCDTQNRTDSCSLEQDSIIFNQTNETEFQYSFTVSRPNHTGNGTNLFNEIVNNSKDLKEILFISLQYHLNMDIRDFDKNQCSFFVVCHNDM